MTAPAKILSFCPERLVDPQWPQKALADWRNNVPCYLIAETYGVSVGRLKDIMTDKARIERVARMYLWSKR